MARRYVACWVDKELVPLDKDMVEAWFVANCGHQHKSFAQVEGCLPLGGFVRAVKHGKITPLTEEEIAQYLHFVRDFYRKAVPAVANKFISL